MIDVARDSSCRDEIHLGLPALFETPEGRRGTMKRLLKRSPLKSSAIFELTVLASHPFSYKYL
jgi:hypothetical protein